MLMTATKSPLLSPDVILKAANRAARAIPPLWPLASSVAVNPFLGQTSEPLATAAARLRRAAGIALTMPRPWYAERVGSGEIAEKDLQAAFEAAPATLRPKTFAALKQAIQSGRPKPQAIPTIADLARDVAAIDWPGVVNDRISRWASDYFDQGQALWAKGQQGAAYAAWRIIAAHDLTPEIVGLAGFAQSVADAPTNAEDAITECVARLGLSEEALESYFHRLLITLGGWSQAARYRLWQTELRGGTDASVTDLLAIRLTWEAALLRKLGSALELQWQAAIAAYAEPVSATSEDVIDAILQEAAERAAQRRLNSLLTGTSSAPAAHGRPRFQMAFCIDVRSEVFRRALESLDPGIRTLGFAGFFGLGIAHRRFASDVVEARLPVLLTPGVFTCSGEATPAVARSDLAARITARAKRAWRRFKLAAISSFAFVEAAGPMYVAKLLHDGLALTRNAAPNDPAPRPANGLDLNTRLTMATSILKAMSLTTGFARLVLLASHGANVVNNPHASTLHCGACGGYSGEVNARLLASLLNDHDVRVGLAERGIAIPEDTLFLAALHDTTTDDVKIYAADHPSTAHADDVDQAERCLKSAGVLARGERALRLPRAAGSRDIPHRARDWAELRPEWGLAGCQAFVAAPRSRTAGRDLAGTAFLHDYNWQRDDGFGVLELILTAPVVVASWISLQYYGSTVAPDLFGAGNKLLHNVIGGIGVVEGNGGLLRTGLPWQSVHDGEGLTHEPLRLSVLIEAPREAIGSILERHPEVRALFDNRWLHLFTLDDEGRMAWRYTGDLHWESCTSDANLERVPLRVFA
ncbi:YbcC family protein [Pseudaminobacter sp. NGMCC 1.201702]|uniref:YbcC family protein n=1 Tax=Pseudaminobacter sp. NGMCC 1.201702 TaxID=3391825 RepID=UPI0039EF142B